MPYGWVIYDRISGSIDWSSFTTVVPPANQPWKRVYKFEICPCATFCSTLIDYTGDEVYPQIYNIDLSDDVGYVTFDYINGADPKKFIVEYLGTQIYNSGFRGDPSRQGDLDYWLLTHGYPTESIVTPSSSSYTFYKSDPNQRNLAIYVYAPLPDYQFRFMVNCPVPTTTTTSTSSTTTSTSTSTSTTSTTTSTSTSTSTSSTTTTSSTTSTTTTLPTPSLRVRFDNTPQQLGNLTLLGLQVRYNNGASFLYSGTNTDLSVSPYFNQNSTTSANLSQNVDVQFTLSDTLNLVMRVYLTIDGGSETLIDTVPLSSGNVFNQTFTNPATYLLYYRFEFRST